MRRKGFCLYHKPACSVGCKKVFCNAHSPERQPIIMESQLKQCESLDHVNCLQFISGNAYQEARRAAHIGCEFLNNNECGHKERYWCKGSVPPFRIEKDNFLEACFGADYRECPNYKVGKAFMAEVERIKAIKSSESQ